MKLLEKPFQWFALLAFSGIFSKGEHKSNATLVSVLVRVDFRLETVLDIVSHNMDLDFLEFSEDSQERYVACQFSSPGLTVYVEKRKVEDGIRLTADFTGTKSEKPFSLSTTEAFSRRLHFEPMDEGIERAIMAELDLKVQSLLFERN